MQTKKCVYVAVVVVVVFKMYFFFLPLSQIESVNIL